MRVTLEAWDYAIGSLCSALVPWDWYLLVSLFVPGGRYEHMQLVLGARTGLPHSCSLSALDLASSCQSTCVLHLMLYSSMSTQSTRTKCHLL